MKKFPEQLLEKLEQRRGSNSLRTLPDAGNLVDFSSNDYLGLSKSAVIFEQAYLLLKENNFTRNGATGSRLISGNHSLNKITEDTIAAFHHSESALVFNSGYDANVGLFSSVPQKGDVVVYDEYIHASIRDGIRLSYAKAYKFRHNDIADLKNLLERHSDKNSDLYIAVESVFSMDGDNAPIAELIILAEKYNCRLIVDEAHALGVYGSTGEGLVQSFGLQDKIFARVITFGKGLGCHGAAVLGSAALKDYLINFARSFIYTTALPPHSLVTILAAYQYLEKEGQKEVLRLKDGVSFFLGEAKRLFPGNTFIPGTSAIHCAVISGNENVKHIASVLKDKGYDVKPILHPTVPQGQERLRICIHSFNTRDEISGMLTALRKVLQ